MTYRGAGVYIFRTRRPGLIGRIYPQVVIALTLAAGVGLWMWGLPWWFAAAGALFSPRHFAYVGESNAVQLRKSAHLYGGGKFNAVAKPWSDLSPSHYYIPLPGAPKWMLGKVETIGIALLWPVYNHSKNLWNPRRIPLDAAKWQRYYRDRWGWSLNIRLAHVAILVGIISFYLGWS